LQPTAEKKMNKFQAESTRLVFLRIEDHSGEAAQKSTEDFSADLQPFNRWVASVGPLLS